MSLTRWVLGLAWDEKYQILVSAVNVTKESDDLGEPKKKEKERFFIKI